MKFEDVRFGLLVVYKNNDIGKVTSIGVYSKDIIINIFDVVDRHVFCTADDIEPFSKEDFMKQKQKEFEVGDIVECSYLSPTTLYRIAHIGKESVVVISMDTYSVRSQLHKCKLDHTDKRPEFVWDNVVHTIDKPFQHTDGNWYIKVDGSVGAIYDKPKQFCYFKTYDNSVQSCEVYAIVPTTPYKYISLDNRWCQDMFLPVTYNQKVIEVTMDDLEKKYGCRVKIVK